MRNRSRFHGASCAGILMREIVLFVEDRAHQLVIGALLRRLAEEHRVGICLVWRQAYGGHGRMKHELNDYLRALRQQREPLPDLIIAATDANCKGLNARTREIADPDPRTPPVVLAIPDPHIERWLLLDGAAFKGRVRSRLPGPGSEMRSRSLQAASGGGDSGCRGRTEPRRHRVRERHHATPGHRPRSTCGRFVPAFHRQLAHRASTLATVNDSRARGHRPTHSVGIRARRELSSVETARSPDRRVVLPVP